MLLQTVPFAHVHLVAKVLAPPLYHTPFTQCHGLFLASPYRLGVPRVKSGPLRKDDQPCLRGAAMITVSHDTPTNIH